MEKKSKRKHKEKTKTGTTEAKADDLLYLVVGGGELGQMVAKSLSGLHVTWSDLSVTANPNDPHPQIFFRSQLLSAARFYIIPLDSPRLHLGEGGTGLANSIYGFIFARVPSLVPLQAVFEFSEFAVTLSELNKLHRLHGAAFQMQRISYYSHGICMLYPSCFRVSLTSALTFTPDPPFMVKVLHPYPRILTQTQIASSPSGVGAYVVRNHDDIADVRRFVTTIILPYRCCSILALHNHYVTVSVVFPLKRIIRVRCLGDHRTAFECTTFGSTQQWDRNTAVPAKDQDEYVFVGC